MYDWTTYWSENGRYGIKFEIPFFFEEADTKPSWTRSTLSIWSKSLAKNIPFPCDSALGLIIYTGACLPYCLALLARSCMSYYNRTDWIGKFQLFGKKVKSSGYSVFIFLSIQANELFYVMPLIAGKWLTRWNDFIWLSLDGSIYRSCQ
jgi:hypothetical protein